MNLGTGTIITINGVIFYLISSLLPPCANIIARIIGSILAIIGNNISNIGTSIEIAFFIVFF
ncbi:MAG: hypothetical protein P0116_02515 [Candidatus Nitrosocosmicus sp.]|nr:hypothetical protein [Candidatus Nitrosocosmicus sp.]